MASHPDPLPPPAGSKPCGEAADLFYQCGGAWGGSLLLTTETLGVGFFNGGYDLRDLVVEVGGVDQSGRPVFSVTHEIDTLPRGGCVRLEVASYEMPSAAAELRVRLVSAEFSQIATAD